jgi:hypothetical protein
VRGGETTKITFCKGSAVLAGHSRSAFSITYGGNSLLGGTMEFCRRSTNFRGPINRKTIEFMRRAKKEELPSVLSGGIRFALPPYGFVGQISESIIRRYR